MSLTAKLYATFAALESTALGLALAGHHGLSGTLQILGLHAAASACLAPATWATLPTGMRDPRGPVLAFLFVQNFFVPGSPVLLRLAHAVGARFRRLLEEAPVREIGEPEYAIYRESDPMRTRAGRIRTKLTNLKVPAHDRLTALLALQETPARASADLLRQLLGDPVEDIRLLAYGMLDGKEKSISERILAEEGRLERPGDEQARFGCHKRLAELFWELAYQRLVEGDMKRYACEQALKHTRAAIALNDADAGLWVLTMRAALALRDLVSAREALDRAAALGFPPEQLAPYEAELAYLDGRMGQVRKSLSRIRDLSLSASLARVRNFWV